MSTLQILRRNAETIASIRVSMILDMMESTGVPCDDDRIKEMRDDVIAGLRVLDGMLRDRVRDNEGAQ